MNLPTLAIGCAAGFSGDRVDAAGPVVETLIAGGLPAVLIFEMLAERTLAQGCEIEDARCRDRLADREQAHRTGGPAGRCAGMLDALQDLLVALAQRVIAVHR